MKKKYFYLILFSFLVLTLPLVLYIFSQSLIFHSSAGNGQNVTVDYSQTVQNLSPRAIGFDESGYGDPNVLTNDPQQLAMLSRQKPQYIRMNLKYSIAGDPNSPIVCGGSGCATGENGDAWINDIKKMGAEPVLEDPSNTADLPNLVRHFNITTHNPVMRWLGGINEPNIHNQTGAVYSAAFNQTFDAMKAIDPNIKIGGPTLAYYDDPFMNTFLRVSGSRVDFIDFHGYPEGATTTLSPAVLFQKGLKYETDIIHIKSLINQIIPTRAGQIDIQVGEWDLNYAGHLQEYTQLNFIWGVSTLGHILKGGADSLLYADKGNMLFEKANLFNGNKVDDATPMYHAIGMFTGESIFPHFGNRLVLSTTSLPNIETYASDNPKSLIIINKDAAIGQTVTVNINGANITSVHAWKKDPTIDVLAPAKDDGSIPIVNNTFTYTMYPYSVTTFIFNSGQAVTLTPTLAATTIAVTQTPIHTPTPTITPSPVISTIQVTPTTKPVITTPVSTIPVITTGIVVQTLKTSQTAVPTATQTNIISATRSAAYTSSNQIQVVNKNGIPISNAAIQYTNKNGMQTTVQTDNRGDAVLAPDAAKVDGVNVDGKNIPLNLAANGIQQVKVDSGTGKVEAVTKQEGISGWIVLFIGLIIAGCLTAFFYIRYTRRKTF